MILVTECAESSIELVGAKAPGEIVYIPEGVSRITPTVNGKAQTIVVKVTAENGEKVAASLQGDLEKRQAENVKPRFDFDHKANGPASAIPTKYRYEPGVGIMCALDWTDSGRKAVEGQDYGYFSPTFLIGEDGSPAGLPGRGSLGALTNEPAFRNMPRIAAEDASEEMIKTLLGRAHSINEKAIEDLAKIKAGLTPLLSQTDTNTMSKLVFAALGIDPAHADAEQSAVQKVEAMKANDSKVKELEATKAELQKEIDTLKKDADAKKAEAAEARKERAKSLIEAAVTDGRIAPKDEDTKGFYAGLIEAGNAGAEAQLAKLPKTHEGIDKPIVTANGNAPDKDAPVLSGVDLVAAALADESK